ncbi:hypothetical protein OEG86_06145 [Hoeflea alexandrii]|uniref:hypothetical protein n=1 Tax=Hoeflea alexandrii TaxID=288436 RepID=UPI00226F2A01|nr:hypothetical protein [Hoeflea alexandrii]MCY0151901.1 hypothetical protein [Hoeflea alexandrii]
MTRSAQPISAGRWDAVRMDAARQVGPYPGEHGEGRLFVQPFGGLVHEQQSWSPQQAAGKNKPAGLATRQARSLWTKPAFQPAFGTDD